MALREVQLTGMVPDVRKSKHSTYRFNSRPKSEPRQVGLAEKPWVGWH